MIPRLFSLILLSGLLLPLNAQRPLHFGASFNWDYGIRFPESADYTPYASGETSLLSFDFHVSVPFLRVFNLSPAYSFSLPTSNMLLVNENAQDVPLGYSLSVPYSSGPDFSYYLYSDDHEYRQSEAWVSQKLYGAFLTLPLGDDYDHFELGSGLFVRQKRAEIYTPVVYDEYEWYGSTGEEWDHYFYTYTYDSGQSKKEVIRERSLAFPLLFQYCHHFGFVYSGGAFVYYLNPDPWMSFRYTIGMSF